MRVKVKLFANLRESLGYAERDFDLDEGVTLREVWEIISREKELQSDVLMAVNKDYARPESEVSEGDEVAFFPPVTGG